MRSKWFGLAWRLAICLGLLAWLFLTIFRNEGREAYQSRGGDWESLSSTQRWTVAWQEGPPRLARTLVQIKPAAGVASLGFMGATIFLGTLRWRRVMRVQGVHLTLPRATAISLVAHFFNSLLLGSTGGDLIKAYYAAGETEQRKTEAVVGVLVDRLLGLLSMLVFAALMMLPNWGLLARHGRLASLSAVVLGMLLVGIFIMIVSFWGGVSQRWPTAREWLRRLPKGPILERALDACRRFGADPRALLQTFSLSMVINLMCVLQIACLAHGLGLDLHLAPLLLIVPVVICISALPITPSGLGVRENLYVWTLAAPGIAIPATSALSLSLLAYAGSLVWSLIGGAVYLVFRQHHPAGLSHADR